MIDELCIPSSVASYILQKCLNNLAFMVNKKNIEISTSYCHFCSSHFPSSRHLHDHYTSTHISDKIYGFHCIL